ncbi:sigma-70 family RNA polymerase sigma factor [Brevibacillus porteri]|uniref:sigma-70 family RNA polymerase sigma factor n=1 Tax=Brevibacillus porteri TaxID=2126350 RepID=UPI003D24F55E
MNIEISDHLKLVRLTIKRYSYTPPSDMDEDDLFQIGCIGLVKAIENFDPSLNYQFSTYAVFRIRAELSHALVYYKREKRTKAQTVRIDQKVKETGALLSEVIADHYSLEDEVMNQERIREAMRIEPIITSCLISRLTHREIGRKMGITPQRVSQRIMAMRKKLMA